MSAAELLRNALEREHENRIQLAPAGERVSVALQCSTERDRFEAAMSAIDHSMIEKERMGLEAAIFALAGVDP